MPNRPTDQLFQLIKSLDKAEKRNFKLYAKRNAAGADLKVVQLFDALDKLDEYDETKLLKLSKSIKKQQLSNIKAHLYKQILNSLRLLKDEGNIDIQLHEQMDHARILFNKGLYMQSLKVLEKIKESSKAHHQVTFWLQALIFEKKIESLYITRSFKNRAELLSKEVEELDDRLVMIGKLSNLALQLYGWYINHGHARNKQEEQSLKTFFTQQLPKHADQQRGFYERMYLYQAYCWYAFILQDLLQYYKYCQRWVDLFEEEPVMKSIETLYYLKGIHNLLNAHFMLRNHQKHATELTRLQKFYTSPICQQQENNQVQAFVHLFTALINQHFMEGSFSKGVVQIAPLEAELEAYASKLDQHRVLVFYYKIACLHFGAGDNATAISYLQKIIHWKTDLRSDLQCYARLLHLIAHYELGNYDILEHLIKSVYRFMAKMESLTVVEEAIFQFLRSSFASTPVKIVPQFAKLHQRLSKLEGSALETRSFMYLDILSWLESKMQGKPVQEIIRQKFLQQQKGNK